MAKTNRLDDEAEIARKKLLAALDDEDEDQDDEDEEDEEDDEEDDEDVSPKAGDRRQRKRAVGGPRTQAVAGEEIPVASPAASIFKVGAVPDHNPELRSLLHRTVLDEEAGLEFANWLEDEDDPRADAVRDLFAPVAAVPPRPDAGVSHPMAAGRQWAAARTKAGVIASAYPGTPLSQLIQAAGGVEATEVKVAVNRQTPEALAEAFRTCRLRFLLALFGTTPAMVAAERVVRDTGAAVDDVLRVLRRVRLNAVPWLGALRRSHPAWFSAVMSGAMRDKQLRTVCDAALDAVDGGWREKLLAEVGNQK